MSGTIQCLSSTALSWTALVCTALGADSPGCHGVTTCVTHPVSHGVTHAVTSSACLLRLAR